MYLSRIDLKYSRRGANFSVAVVKARIVVWW